MLSTKKVVSAMLGLAMLALPATVLASHHEDRGHNARPYAQHDNGSHKGWTNHREDGLVRGVRPGWQNQNYGYAATNPWWRHHRDGYGAVPWQQPYGYNNYNGNNYWGSNYDYGQPPSYYEELPPSGYGSGQQLSWLLQRRQAALVNLNRMRARGDSRAAGRMAQVLNGLDARIRSQGGGRYSNLGAGGYGGYGGYAPLAAYSQTPYLGNGYGNGYGSGYNSLTPYLGNLFGSGHGSNYGNAYTPAYGTNYGSAYPNSGYGNQYYGNSPTTNLLGSLVGPMLGGGLLPH